MPIIHLHMFSSSVINPVFMFSTFKLETLFTWQSVYFSFQGYVTTATWKIHFHIKDIMRKYSLLCDCNWQWHEQKNDKLHQQQCNKNKLKNYFIKINIKCIIYDICTRLSGKVCKITNTVVKKNSVSTSLEWCKIGTNRWQTCNE